MADRPGRLISEPERRTYKDHPVLSIPLLDGKNKEGHAFTFGKRKAEAIVKYMDEIKEFLEDMEEEGGASDS